MALTVEDVELGRIFGDEFACRFAGGWRLIRGRVETRVVFKGRFECVGGQWTRCASRGGGGQSPFFRAKMGTDPELENDLPIVAQNIGAHLKMHIL